jgi:hypothetical protein
MKANVKQFHDQFKDNINDLPINTLEQIVYNKNFEYMLDLEDYEEHGETMNDIMESVDYGKRLRLFAMLYSSSIDASVIHRELIYKEELLRQLLRINRELFQMEGLKSHYNMIENYKNTKDITYLDKLQSDIESTIEAKYNALKSIETQLKMVIDIWDGKKENFEYFRSKKDIEWCKKAHPKLYALLTERVYVEKDIVNLYGNNNILNYTKALITDLLNDMSTKKTNYKFINSESETYKYLANMANVED